MKITTNLVTFTSDAVIDFSKWQNVIDFGFANQGTTLAILNNIYNLNPVTSPSDAPIFSVPNYTGAIRQDRWNVNFTGGTGLLIVFITSIVEQC